MTGLLSFGVGLQDESDGSASTGMGGLNLGVGAFIGERAAVLLRASGTNVAHAGGRRISGTVGIALELWLLERLRLDAGVGAGVAELLGSAGREGLEVDPGGDVGFGLIAGVSYVLWAFDGHEITLGLEYAPAFTEPRTIQNFGLVLGWQRL